MIMHNLSIYYNYLCDSMQFSNALRCWKKKEKKIFELFETKTRRSQRKKSDKKSEEKNFTVFFFSFFITTISITDSISEFFCGKMRTRPKFYRATYFSFFFSWNSTKWKRPNGNEKRNSSKWSRQTRKYMYTRIKKTKLQKKIVAQKFYIYVCVVVVVWKHALACSSRRYFQSFSYTHTHTSFWIVAVMYLASYHQTHTHLYVLFIWHYTYLYRIWILITFGLRQHVPDFGNKFFDFSSLCEKDMTTILVDANVYNIYKRTHTPAAPAVAWLPLVSKNCKKRHKNLRQLWILSL